MDYRDVQLLNSAIKVNMVYFMCNFLQCAIWLFSAFVPSAFCTVPQKLTLEPCHSQCLQSEHTPNYHLVEL